MNDLPKGPPDDAWAKSVCRIGKGENTCRYLTMSAEGWCCEKRSPLAAVIDERVATMSAKGDNCAGRDPRREGEKQSADEAKANAERMQGLVHQIMVEAGNGLLSRFPGFALTIILRNPQTEACFVVTGEPDIEALIEDIRASRRAGMN